MQKKDRFGDARSYYEKSLTLRERHAKKSDHREVQLAQSYVSLGNLFLEMEDYARALDSLKRAKQCYVAGFKPDHPKVAWAVEAMANVYKKQKAWRLADEAIDEAIAIRRALQAKSDGQQLFSKELGKAEVANIEIEAQRKIIQDKIKKSSLVGLMGGAKKGSSNILLAAKAAKMAQNAEDPTAKPIARTEP